jgi:biotin carboxyl carrier protein
LLAAVFALGLPAALAAAPPDAFEATIQAVAGTEVEIKASISLKVTALPVPAGRPASVHAVLVAVDVSGLEAELVETQRRVTAAQTEQRRMTTNQDVVRGGGSSGSSGPPSRADMWAQSTADSLADAQRDLTRLQGRIAGAAIRAPADGYLLRPLVEVGDSTRKRKPAALFVPLAGTTLTVTVLAERAPPLSDALVLRIADAADPERSFRGRLESSEPAGEQVRFHVVPLELPFLELDRPTAVTLAIVD